MSEKFFVVIDIDKIQEYVFRNIKLKPIFGASLLVAELTSHDFCKTESILKEFEEAKEIKELSSGKRYLPIFFGGGNIKIIFSANKDTLTFVEDMQRIFIRKAHGATFSHVIYKFTDNFDNNVIEQAEKELKKIKQSKWCSIQPNTNPCFDLCTLCRTYPANLKHRDGKFVCENCFCALKSFDNFLSMNNKDILLKRFHEQFSNNLHCKFMNEFDDIKDDKSYLAVLNMDANDIGDKIVKCTQNKVNDTCVTALKDFSTGLNNAVIEMLINSLKDNIFTPEEIGKEEAPFRPIIIGGDDICLVIAGNKAIRFICNFIDNIKKNPFCISNAITFSIGVCFVKSHYPFSFAHKLSEQLLASAKAKKSHGNVIDWETLNTSTIEGLTTIRNERYSTKHDEEEYVLTYKPYNFKDDDFRGFNNFVDVSRGLETILKSSKFKELRQIVRENKTVSSFMFRKLISKLTDEDKKKIDGFLIRLKLQKDTIWWHDNNKLYNNFLDIVEISEFIP